MRNLFSFLGSSLALLHRLDLLRAVNGAGATKCGLLQIWSVLLRLDDVLDLLQCSLLSRLEGDATGAFSWLVLKVVKRSVSVVCQRVH